jgi:hypothetical protein
MGVLVQEEVVMKRILVVLAGVLAIGALPAVAYAQSAAQAKPADTQKTLTAVGAVTKVANDSLTIKVKTAEMTFTIDKETTVIAKGATTKSLALKAEGKSTTLMNFVKVGDSVTVSYHDLGATKHAANIRVDTQVK